MSRDAGPPLLLHRAGDVQLESGEVLHDVRQAYRLEGRFSAARDNLVVVFHSLTGRAEDFGGFAPELVGPGKAIDTARWAVLTPNLLGSCYGSRFRFDGPGQPAITTRDMARLAGRLVRDLEVRSVALATGGSLGGMVTLEFAASFPGLVRAGVVFAAPAVAPAWAAAWNHLHRVALRLGGADGLALARMVGMLSYRSPEELASRFGGAAAVRAWLERHGAALADRFDAASYGTLLDALDTHDVGRGRGGAGRALRASGTRLLAVGIPGDLLYPDTEVHRWADAAAASYRELRSPRGHDAFLLEPGKVGPMIEGVLRRSTAGSGWEPSVSSAAGGS